MLKLRYEKYGNAVADKPIFIPFASPKCVTVSGHDYLFIMN